MKSRQSSASTRPARPASFPIVGIGASAGGLEAFSELLHHLPEHTGMAFVLVQHLDPKHASDLRQILSRTTRIPVQEATQGAAVKPDHIYVIPPNTNLSVKKGFCGWGRACSPGGSTCRLTISWAHWQKTAETGRSA